MGYPGAFTNSGFAGKEVESHSLLLTALQALLGVLFSCGFHQTDWFHANNTSSFSQKAIINFLSKASHNFIA
jgi:hypothetical protein